MHGTIGPINFRVDCEANRDVIFLLKGGEGGGEGGGEINENIFSFLVNRMNFSS